MIYLFPFLLLFAACGDDGDNDTIWTGLSGVLLFGIIAIIVLHYIRKGSK